jgi:hypothetical protein
MADQRTDFVSRADAARMAEEAAQRAVKEAFSALAAQQPANSETNDLVERLALAIGHISAQNTGKKYTAPEVIVRRDKAFAAMKQAIARYRAEGIVPVYTLHNTVFLDEMIVIPTFIGHDHVQRPTEIGWPAAPSMAMRPKNDAARDIFAHFLDSVGETFPENSDIRRVSPSGLVVLGEGAGPRREMPQIGRGAGTEGLTITGRGQTGPVVETRVLGTIAPPARQQA